MGAPKPLPSVTGILAGFGAARAANPIDPNPEAQALADSIRSRARIVHTSNALQAFESDSIRLMGLDPNEFVAVACVGDVQLVPGPNGTTLIAIALNIPRGFFPALEERAIMDANGAMHTAKFNRQLALPISARFVIRTEGLGEATRKSLVLLRDHEGKTYGELEDAGYEAPVAVPAR